MSETFTATNEWLYRQIVENSSVAVIYGDTAGVMRLWNKGAKDIFGWTAEEAVGQSMDLIIPEKYRAKHWEGYDQVMKTGITKYGRNVLAVPALTKDGRRISIEFTVVLLKAPSGQVAGIAALIDPTYCCACEPWCRNLLAMAAVGRFSIQPGQSRYHFRLFAMSTLARIFLPAFGFSA